MRLLQTIVAKTGFRTVPHNAQRLAALDQLLYLAHMTSVDLVLLPGGYLTAKDEIGVSELIADVERRASVAGTTLAFGVDFLTSSLGGKSKGKGVEEKGGRNACLPYFGAVCGRSNGGPWRQTSDDNCNAADVEEGDVPGATRVVDIAGRRVGVLICGELFSRRARKSVAELNLDLVIDLGHVSMGTGVTRAMENIARNGGCTVAHTQHVISTSNGGLHFVEADGERRSVPISDCEWFGDDDFWIAWRLREL